MPPCTCTPCWGAWFDETCTVRLTCCLWDTRVLDRNTGAADPVPGCATTLSGAGSATLSNLPYDITSLAFTVAAAGCNANGTTFYEAGLQLTSGHASPYFAIPLAHTSLKVANLAATVAHTNASQRLEVGLIGTLGGSAQNDTVLDMMLLFTEDNYTVAGVLRGPVSIGALVMVLAPGASITDQDPHGYLGAVDDALVMIGSDGNISAALKISVFNLSCTAQLVIGGDGGSGKARIALYVAIQANDGACCAHAAGTDDVCGISMCSSQCVPRVPFRHGCLAAGHDHEQCHHFLHRSTLWAH